MLYFGDFSHFKLANIERLLYRWINDVQSSQQRKLWQIFWGKFFYSNMTSINYLFVLNLMLLYFMKSKESVRLCFVICPTAAFHDSVLM